MLHHPAQIAHPAAAQQVIAVITGVIIPARAVHRENTLPVQGVEHILVGQEQFPAVSFHIGQQRRKLNFLPSRLQVHPQHTGVVVVTLGSKT